MLFYLVINILITKYINEVNMKKKLIIGLSFLVLLIIGIIFYVPDKDNNDISLNQKVETMPSVIVVQIKGEVFNPGIYSIDKGSRVQDLVSLAGGATRFADMDDLNLVKVLSDSDCIIIKKKENIGSASRLININTATYQDLMTLSGIGESKAMAIVEYRQANGSFTSLDDLLKVPGISQSLLYKIYMNICY